LSLVNVKCFQVEVSAKGRSLVQRSPTLCVCVCVCVCVSASVVKRNNNPLHLHSVGGKDQTQMERKNYTKHINTMCGKSDEFLNVKGRWYDIVSSAVKR
jgi:hypothetical protein